VTEPLHYPADLYGGVRQHRRLWFRSSLFTSVAVNGSAYNGCSPCFTSIEKGRKDEQILGQCGRSACR